jgi:hypothetical protein
MGWATNTSEGPSHAQSFGGKAYWEIAIWNAEKDMER